MTYQKLEQEGKIAMKLFEITFNTWNDSFSGLNRNKLLAVGTDSKDAILRVRKITEKDARDFKATEIKAVMGYSVLVGEAIR